MTSSYDFIVVGGGTAGLVVATRLSEIPEFNVLVIEAGGDHSNDSRVTIPALWTSLLGTEADWGFITGSQAGLGGRAASLNQGKALGGSSAINAQVFVPPTEANTDDWETLGNEGWNWELLQRYITRAYTSPSVDPELDKALDIAGWTGRDDLAKGPIRTSYPQVIVQEAWAAALKNISHSVSKDPFLGVSTGSFSNLNSIDPVAKERSYAASMYYHPIRDRKNLIVLTGAHVEKITLEHNSDGPITATGVEYTQQGEKHLVTATKEVILSAGALQSPKVLELSGIGNSEILSKHNIGTLVDIIGVGENLQDHLVCGVSYKAADSVETLDALLRQEPEAIAKAMGEYTENRTGAFTGGGIDAYAYLPVAIVPVDLTFDPSSPTGPISGNFLTVAALLSHPVSRGSVHIAAADPAAPPTVDPAYLSHPADVEVFAQHMLQAETIAKAAGGALFEQPLQRRDPATDLQGDLNRAKRLVRASSVSMWHPVGACAMLPLEQHGVVDPELRVHKVRGLRVVDSSVMPLITTANPQATVYGIAERAADLIKTTWKVV